MSFENFVFVGFNSRVLALERETGEIVWQWRSPKVTGGGYVTLLLDGDRLIVSVNGYLSCLDPVTGETLWNNDTKGCGIGVASIASVRGHFLPHVSAIAAAQAEAANSSAAGT